MKTSFEKILKKFEKKRKHGKNVFLIVSETNRSVMYGLNEDASLDTLLVYKKNKGKELLTGFINNVAINDSPSITILLDLEDEESPNIYFDYNEKIEKLGEDLNDILAVFCEFKQFSFFFYTFNTNKMQIGMKLFNQNKLSTTQFFKHSFLNTLPYLEKNETEALLFPAEESFFKEYSKDGE